VNGDLHDLFGGESVLRPAGFVVQGAQNEVHRVSIIFVQGDGQERTIAFAPRLSELLAFFEVGAEQFWRKQSMPGTMPWKKRGSDDIWIPQHCRRPE
jgi:hypothetical protein